MKKELLNTFVKNFKLIDSFCRRFNHIDRYGVKIVIDELSNKKVVNANGNDVVSFQEQEDKYNFRVIKHDPGSISIINLSIDKDFNDYEFKISGKNVSIEFGLEDITFMIHEILFQALEIIVQSPFYFKDTIDCGF